MNTHTATIYIAYRVANDGVEECRAFATEHDAQQFSDDITERPATRLLRSIKGAVELIGAPTADIIAAHNATQAARENNQRQDLRAAQIARDGGDWRQEYTR